MPETVVYGENPNECYLGFDFGEKRVGVSVGQSFTATARGISTLISKNRQPDWDGISQLIDEWQPAALIVGIPRHMDGSDTEVTRLAQRFANRLNGRYHLPIHLVDERLTSFEAEQQLQAEQTKVTKEDIDKRAAAIILTSWLNET